MTVDTSDLHDHDVTIGAYDSPPSVISTDTTTIVVPLAQDEALTLIQDIAKASWAGGAHLVIETSRPTYPDRSRGEVPVDDLRAIRDDLLSITDDFESELEPRDEAKYHSAKARKIVDRLTVILGDR